MSVSFSARVLLPGAEYATPVDDVEDVNLNNGNAAHLLGLLELRGVDVDGDPLPMCGELPAAAFAERVALVEVYDLVGARPGTSDGRWHEVGTSAQYLRARLEDLAELARAAAALAGVGAGTVSWG